MLPVLTVFAIYHVLKRRITILHGHGFLSGVVCMVTSAFTRVPYVMTIQSADFTIYHPEVRLNLLVRLQAALERLVYRRAHVCHAVSRDLCNHYERQSRKDCVLIPNGVNMNHHHPISLEDRRNVRKRFGIEDDALVVSTVGRLEPKAGIPELIKAFALFRKSNERARLVVVGDGSLRYVLEKQVQDAGLTESVYFLGGQSYADVGPIVASSDIFARTPRSEGFGIVFIEAMAAGIPVIGTSVGGIPDFIKDGKTGLLVPPEDPDATVQALQQLVTDDDLYAQLRSNALLLIEREYNWDSIAKKIGMLYNKTYH